MILNNKEIERFLDSYYGIAERGFSGQKITLYEGTTSKYGENDYTAIKNILDKRLVSVSTDSKGVDQIFIDNNGEFIQFEYYGTSYKISKVIPSISDFKE